MKRAFFAYSKRTQDTKTLFLNGEADQRLYFRKMVRTIHLLTKFEISSIVPSSVAEQLYLS